MDVGERMAAEGLALVGVRFRLHGRSVETGVDCVGLVALAARRAGVRVPTLPTYKLRGMGQARAVQNLAACGLSPAPELGEGAVLLVDSGPMQLHLMIVTRGGHVHAHAGLGKVVLMPGPSPWPVLGAWQFQE
ncbi:cell wall-associated NlpC family hydrolase [Sphingobium sp. B1D7B]|uniref:peptidoglycan endopeptidase n=1 Tax=unclassified Sphingobium TaxID=2611147 RepID=UPI002224632A|nr:MULTISPECIES: peptidoglycan endopeptidase [unclassified Sphingobium]MCW2391553.1 cell wall-associated NlpC family hydrolase [Sphingobium sp. B11D3A]MCW2406769.1 cell wall-associated NlpC family hydrolase [Sphingobium sp. B1D7B]